MKPDRLMIAMLSALALGSVASAVRAQQSPARLLLTANEFSGPAVGPETTHSTLEWDSKKGRWGLRLGVQQHMDHNTDWRDYQPGLYYKITPRLHIGGAVSLAPDQIDMSRPGDPQAPPPRVRLETTFKF